MSESKLLPGLVIPRECWLKHYPTDTYKGSIKLLYFIDISNQRLESWPEGQAEIWRCILEDGRDMSLILEPAIVCQYMDFNPREDWLEEYLL